MWDVAIIGAGLSGVTCGRQLQAAGYRVCLLDKSRGLGGRMATRRVSRESSDDVRVDHGLRYWQPASDELKALTEELLATKVLKPWQASHYEIREAGVTTPVEESTPRYVAEAGMSAIAKYLTKDFTPDENLLTNHSAVSLRYQGGGWQITCEGGQLVSAKRCAIAIPAPQAADLLKNSDAAKDFSVAIDQLSAVTYSPCITVLAGYCSRYNQQMGELDPKGWAVTDFAGTSTDWTGLDSSKRASADRPVIVIHSKVGFAQQYLDLGDLQPAASVLLRANARKFADWIAQPEWFQIHRWRYAYVENAYSGSVLNASETLACGGDWCVPSTQKSSQKSPPLQPIDHAYLSGLALGEAIEKKLIV